MRKSDFFSLRNCGTMGTLPLQRPRWQQEKEENTSKLVRSPGAPTSLGQYPPGWDQPTSLGKLSSESRMGKESCRSLTMGSGVQQRSWYEAVSALYPMLPILLHSAGPWPGATGYYSCHGRQVAPLHYIHFRIASPPPPLEEYFRVTTDLWPGILMLPPFLSRANERYLVVRVYLCVHCSHMPDNESMEDYVLRRNDILQVPQQFPVYRIALIQDGWDRVSIRSSCRKCVRLHGPKGSFAVRFWRLPAAPLAGIGCWRRCG